MALIKTLQIPVSGFGVVQIPNAYCMITSPTFDKISLAGNFSVTVWKDQATRAAYGAAQADFVAKSTAYNVANAALKSLLPAPGDTSEQILAKEDASVPARAAEFAARQNRDAAIDACNEIKSIKLGGDISFSFDALTSSAISTNGVVDVAKCYLWLKSQPDWSDAKDA